jgi:tetratricopeptide (TPR) repeat protein
MPPIFQEVWKFLSDNAGPLQVLLACLVLLPFGAVIGGAGWLIRRWWLGRLPVDLEVFEVIADPATLLPKIYNEENDSGPLADHRIPYQPRDPGRDLQAELRQALHSSRYLLITARTGLGKTREAATLAQSLMNEGYRAIRIKTGWLDRLKEFPPELKGDRRRILILLDDVNGLFSTGGHMQSPRAEQMPMLGQPSYHDRLLGALDDFEKMCGPGEIRVLATARDEAEQWRMLDFNPTDRLWRRFTRFELPEPKHSAQAELLAGLVKQAGLPAADVDYAAIARQNDGTYMNIVLNLGRLRAEDKPLTAEDYTPTLGGSWQEVYERALGQHPAVRPIYEAIGILRQAGIDLYPWLVKPTARRVWGGNVLERGLRRVQIHRALRHLVDEKILAVSKGRLSPRDGQIEAKGTEVDWKPQASFLEGLVLRMADRQPRAMLESLMGFGIAAYVAKQPERAAGQWKKGTELAPENAGLWSNLGLVLADLNRPAEAEAAYRQALAKDPNLAQAYSNLGNLLGDLNRPAEAEEAYRQALAKDPNDATAYYNLGILLRKLNRPAEAEEMYRKGLAISPDDASLLNNLTLLLRLQDRARDALPLLDKLAALAPQDFNPHLARACIHRQLGDLALSAHHAGQARALIPPDDWYNLACLESICGNVEAALEALRRAAEAEKFDREWVRRDPDLQWIRDDPRFGEILGNS